MAVFERVGGVVVLAKRGGASNLLIGDPDKSVMPLRTLEEIFMSSRKPENRPDGMGYSPYMARFQYELE